MGNVRENKIHDRRKFFLLSLGALIGTALIAPQANAQEDLEALRANTGISIGSGADFFGDLSPSEIKAYEKVYLKCRPRSASEFENLREAIAVLEQQGRIDEDAAERKRLLADRGELRIKVRSLTRKISREDDPLNLVELGYSLIDLAVTEEEALAKDKGAREAICSSLTKTIPSRLGSTSGTVIESDDLFADDVYLDSYEEVNSLLTTAAEESTIIARACGKDIQIVRNKNRIERNVQSAVEQYAMSYPYGQGAQEAAAAFYKELMDEQNAACGMNKWGPFQIMRPANAQQCAQARATTAQMWQAYTAKVNQGIMQAQTSMKEQYFSHLNMMNSISQIGATPAPGAGFPVPAAPGNQYGNGSPTTLPYPNPNGPNVPNGNQYGNFPPPGQNGGWNTHGAQPYNPFMDMNQQPATAAGTSYQWFAPTQNLGFSSNFLTNPNATLPFAQAGY